MTRLTPLTLIGKSGEGKSTACNMILGKREFATSSMAQSYTETITSCEVPDANIILYDTPGIGDTEGRSEEFFQKITDHLYEHGGVIAFVQSQSRVDHRVKNHLYALSLILEGLPFSTCCVLITTKLNCDSFLTPEENRQELDQYQQDLEQECLKMSPNARGTHDLFARRYAYSTFLSDTCQAFVKAIKEDVPAIRGIAPGTVLTWDAIVQLSQQRITDATQKRELLAKEVARLENVLATVETSKNWHTRYYVTVSMAAAGMTYLENATVPVMGASMLSTVLNSAIEYGAKISKRAVDQLEQQLIIIRRELQIAKENLRTLNMVVLEAKAKRIRELVA